MKLNKLSIIIEIKKKTTTNKFTKHIKQKIEKEKYNDLKIIYKNKLLHY